MYPVAFCRLYFDVEYLRVVSFGEKSYFYRALLVQRYSLKSFVYLIAYVEVKLVHYFA